MVHTDAIEGVSGPGRIGRVAIGDLLHRTARRHPSRIALTEGERKTSYSELEAAANRFAHHLLSLDLGKGARVSTICNNSTELVAAIFGIHKAGLVWVAINTMLDVSDARYILDHAEVSLTVIDDDLYRKSEWRNMISERAVAVIVNTVTELSIESNPCTFRQVCEGQLSTEPDIDIHERDLALIMYTSGTTSRPKGAMHCHLALMFGALNNTIEWKLDRSDAVSGVLPLFHVAQYGVMLYFMSVGGKIALLKGFDAEEVMQTIARDRLTVTVMLPMMYAAILNHPRRREYDLSSLRLCAWGMAPIAKELLTRLVQELCPNFVLGSGQTEMFPSTTSSRPERALERFGNYWGESHVINETAIMDDEGKLLEPGNMGEIVHRGPNVMMGYYKEPAATLSSRAFGWHHTGDLALVDEHGEILFVDRKKDMIKSGGENVSSVAVEAAMLSHPAVKVAAAIGLPHPRWGEAVTGFIELNPGICADEQSIIDHSKRSLAGFQVPKKVKILRDLPFTASGKIKKADLKLQFEHLYDEAQEAMSENGRNR